MLLARLQAASELSKAEGDLRDLPPLPAGTQRGVTQDLLAMRDQERY